MLGGANMYVKPKMEGSLLLMGDLTIPDVNVLVLSLETNGHAFERSVLRLLTKCSCITKLILSFQVLDEVQNYCLQGYICHTEPEVEVVPLSALTEVDIVNYLGTPAQLYVVEQLLAKAPRIRLLRIIISEAEDPSLGTIESLCPAGCLLELVWC